MKEPKLSAGFHLSQMSAGTFNKIQRISFEFPVILYPKKERHAVHQVDRPLYRGVKGGLVRNCETGHFRLFGRRAISGFAERYLIVVLGDPKKKAINSAKTSANTESTSKSNAEIGSPLEFLGGSSTRVITDFRARTASSKCFTF